MPLTYYENQLSQLADLAEKSVDKQSSFSQSLLIVSVTLLGIVVSLHDSTTDILLLRFLFALAVVLLSLGILSCAVTLYGWTMHLEKVRQEFSQEAQNALKESRKLKTVFVERDKIYLFSEKATYTLLSLSLLLLVIHSVISTFS